MKDDKMKIEQRIQNMQKFYVKAADLIDSLPDAVPEKAKNLIKDKILGDKDLKVFMEGLDSNRPPRFFIIGRTGVGKSSLINALCGSYLAAVSDVESCTENSSVYKYMDGERVLMEIFDTRGTSESESLDKKQSAEDALIEQVSEFSPDAAVFVLSCTHRDDVNSDVEFLKRLAKNYSKVNGVHLPIVVVVNKCDEMAPSRFKKPSEYPQNKIDKIQEAVNYYKGIIVKNGLKIDNMVAVSSLIDWQTKDGLEIDVKDIENLPQEDIENLQIAFDGRYNIEKLLDILEEAIPDIGAQMGLRMAARLNEVAGRLAKHLNTIFSAISAAVAATPIPIADVYVLLLIQALLVCLIASLSGRDLSIENGLEFILSLGGVVGIGNVFRFIAHQAFKLFPGAGNVIGSGIAAVGTNTIGSCAIEYYINGKPIREAKKLFRTANKARNDDRE